MTKLLQDIEIETRNKFNAYMLRAKRNIKLKDKPTALTWLQRALAQAMTHVDDFKCRKLIDKMSKKGKAR